MKNLSRAALAALLLGAGAPVRAASPARQSEEVRRYAYADQALDTVSKKIGEVKGCVSRLEAAKKEAAEKKSEIAAENNGVVPPAYNDVIAMRNARVSRLRTSCFSINKELTALFEDARLRIKGIEPPSSSGVPRRRERLASLEVLANSVAKNLR